LRGFSSHPDPPYLHPAGVWLPLRLFCDSVSFLRDFRDAGSYGPWFEIAHMRALLSDQRLIPGTPRGALRRPRAGLPRTFSPRYTAGTGST